MAYNEEEDLNTLNDADASLNSTRSDAIQPRSIRTDPGESPRELVRHNQTNNLSFPKPNNNVDASLRRICSKYEIQSKMVEHLRKLQNFEIVIVCDDSGSMMTPVDGTQRTRWDELCSIVKIIVDIGVIFDLNGVDIYFLNRDSYLKVKNPEVVDQAFQRLPCGYTPLVPVLNEIFESPLSRRGRDKKLLVFVATDGEPTDNNGNPQVDELKLLMKEKRQVDTTFISFLLCTDVAASVDYLNEWDRTMQNVDVTDDFNTEKEKIRRCRKQNNYPFSYGDYVVKALIGAINREIDILNEPV